MTTETVCVCVGACLCSFVCVCVCGVRTYGELHLAAPRLSHFHMNLHGLFSFLLARVSDKDQRKGDREREGLTQRETSKTDHSCQPYQRLFTEVF